MGRGQCQVWLGVLAVVFGMAVTGPAQGDGAAGRAPAAMSNELEEAKRLTQEVKRLRQQGKYDEALPRAERALAILEKVLGPDHPEVASSLRSLAVVYRNKGDYDRAETMCLRSLAILKRALGPDHPEVARVHIRDGRDHAATLMLAA